MHNVSRPVNRVYSITVTIVFYLVFTVINYFGLHVFHTWGVLSTHSTSFMANIALTVVIVVSVLYFRDKFFTWASLDVIGRLLDSATTYYALQFPFFYESNPFIASILDKPQYVFLLNMAVGVAGGIYVATFMTLRPDPRDKLKYFVSLVLKVTSLNVLLSSWQPVINNILTIIYTFLTLWL
jgi:hypothetical protein